MDFHIGFIDYFAESHIRLTWLNWLVGWERGASLLLPLIENGNDIPAFFYSNHGCIATYLLLFFFLYDGIYVLVGCLVWLCPGVIIILCGVSSVSHK